LTIVVSTLLAACAGEPELPDTDVTPASSVPAQTPAAVPSQTVDAGLRAASDGLVADAQSARATGALDRADALLQRAQRLDPSNASIYLELAMLYGLRGQSQAARAAAERGLLYCEGDDCVELRRIAQP
jgi:Flp pilus assembly protein TadD